jgi:conserved oligomeric Golgi complex subunit 6
MSVSYFQDRTTPSSQDVLSPATPSAGAASRGANALSSRITSVLSASYADLEIRDALETLDARGVRNTAETRRQIRLDVQKEVIQCNGEIVRDFGEVAEVSRSTRYLK